MAVTAAPAQGLRAVRPRHFARLKLRVLRNGMRGSTVRVLTFVFGSLATVYFGAIGFLVFALPGLLDRADVALLVAGLGGPLLVTGWVVLPLIFFGVDESLDPARFALLPLPRRTLVAGLFTAALIGLPPTAVVLAAAGLVVGTGALGGWPAATVAVVGALGGLLLCVAASRAVTSAFAGALRARKSRDLAAVVLAALAALIGPLQLTLLGRAGSTDWRQVQAVAAVLAWTPFGAPFTVGLDMAAGRYWAIPVKLVITAVTVAALLWWWSRSLENAMLGGRGTASAAPAARAAAPRRPVTLLVPRAVRWLPRGRFAALVAREVRYWWREPRRRASLLTLAVIGIFLPVVSADRDAPLIQPSGALTFVALMAALSLANQFGYEGTAYAANMIAGVPGRTELHSRAFGFTVYVGPALLAVAIGVGVAHDPAWIPALIGAVLVAYGSGTALATLISVVAAYAMPDTANPFAISTGGGIAKSFLAFAVLVVGGLFTAPYLVAGVLVGPAWLWLALPVAVVYGGGAYLLGLHLTGRLLDRRMPELLATVAHRG